MNSADETGLIDALKERQRLDPDAPDMIAIPDSVPATEREAELKPCPMDGALCLACGGTLGHTRADSVREPAAEICAEMAREAATQQAKFANGMGSEQELDIADRYKSMGEALREAERRIRALASSAPEEQCCGQCGGPHPFDTSVPSVVWNRVIRSQGWSDFLCTTCIVRAFAQIEEGFTATLWGNEFNGISVEFVINGQNAKDAALVQEENNALRWQIRECKDALQEEAQKALDAQLASSAPAQPGNLPTEDLVSEDSQRFTGAKAVAQPDSVREWQPIEQAPKNRKLIVGYWNPLGNWRSVMGCYYANGTLESDVTDSGWAEEGWYEETEAYEYLMPMEQEPVLFQPLPDPPVSQGKEGEKR